MASKTKLCYDKTGILCFYKICWLSIKNKPGSTFQIIGHTDGDGEAEYNMYLSKGRAESVKAILVSQFGVDDTKLIAIGKGETDKVDNNNTASGKANNRRVESIKQ